MKNLSVLLFFVELSERIQDKVGITRRLNTRGKYFVRLLKLKPASGYFNDLPKAERAAGSPSFGVNNSSFVEVDAPSLGIVR